MEINDVAQQCVNGIRQRYQHLKTLNIVVIGKAGVGKSTLINTLFRDNLAATGVGRSVTDKVRMYTKENYPLCIYDTPGFELGSEQQKKVKEEVTQLIQTRARSLKLETMIHCVWYCINVGSNRTLDDSEIEFLRSLTENPGINVPVFIILTQAFPKKKAQDMKADVEALNLRVVKVLPVLAQDMDCDGEYTAPAYGLEELARVMTEVLPQELQETFQNVQIVCLSEKVRQARKAVTTAVTASVAAAATPLPFSDCAALVPIEVAMISSITICFGMELDRGFLTAFVSSTLGAGGATVLGKSIVAGLLKLIPGVGFGATAVSAATAGLLTTALGETYINVMQWMFKNGQNAGYLKSAEGKARMKEEFQNQLRIAGRRRKDGAAL